MIISARLISAFKSLNEVEGHKEHFRLSSAFLVGVVVAYTLSSASAVPLLLSMLSL